MFHTWVGIALAAVAAVLPLTATAGSTATATTATVEGTAAATGNAAATLVNAATARLDLGIVAVGDEPRFEFRLVNDRDVPLTLRPTAVPPGLAITAIDTTLAPGARGRIELALDGFAVAGPTSLETTLATDDPARPEVRLTVLVDVRPFVVADPGSARYLFVRGAKEGTIGQTLWARDGAGFHVTHVASPSPSLRVRARAARASERVPDVPGPQWRVEATIASLAPVGPLTGSIELTLDHSRQHRLRIPVSGFVRPMFAVTPPAGDLGTVAAGATVRGRFLVKNFADEAVTIEYVRADVPGFVAAITTVDPGHVFTIGLTVTDDAPAGAFDGRLHVRTSSPKERDLEIPISGTIRDADDTVTSQADPRH